MAESEHDDLADALARMAAGDIAPSEHEPAAPPPPPKTRVVKPVTNRPATVKPASSTPSPKLPPATPAAPRPEAPVRARPAAPSLGNASPPPRAAAPAPAQAPAPVAAPVARKPRPAAPTTRSVTEQPPPETDGTQSTELYAGAGAGQVGDGQVIDDDDAMLAPAPDPSVFEYRSKTTAEARAKVARQKNLNFRRTLIPILLTCGMLLIGFASLKFLSGQDSGLSAWPIWIPGILVFMAVVLLSLAVVNMISVAKQQGRDA